MLVTKREVKRTSKKLLSVLLAVIMLMSTMSVCFGTISFAANDTGAINAFVTAMQCDAMKRFNPSTSNAANAASITYTYTASSYADYVAISNVISKLDAAIKGLDEYKNGATHNNNSNCSDGWVSGQNNVPESQKNECTDTGYLLKYLKYAIGDATLATLNGTYNFQKLCDAVFSTHQCQYRNADGTEDDVAGEIASSSVPDELTNILIVKTDTFSDKFLEYASISAIPDTIENQTSYTIKMYEQNWTSTEKSGCSTKTVNHRHIAINTTKHTPTVSKSSTNIDKSLLTNAQSTFDSYSNYLNAADVNDVLAISKDSATLTAANGAILAQKTNVVNAYGTAVYNKFFPKVDTALKNISDAIDFLAFESLADEIKALYGVDFSRMNESETLAHLTAFRTKWAEFTKLEQATQDLVSSTYNIDVDAIEERIQEISDTIHSVSVTSRLLLIHTSICMNILTLMMLTMQQTLQQSSQQYSQQLQLFITTLTALTATMLLL